MIPRRISVLALTLSLLAFACSSGQSSDEAASPSTSQDTSSNDAPTSDPEPIDVAAIRQCDLGPAPEEPDPEVAAEPVTFSVEGDTAIMTGNIGSDIVHKTCDLMREDPDVQVVEVADVPGSSTLANETLDAGLALNSGGLETYVPSDGQIESGGVDYFLAGTERNVEDGGCLGVHSTEIESDQGPVAAGDLPRDDPEHQPFLEYFRAIGIPEDFYWFTLEAASPSGIHYLTPEEMSRFQVTTGPVPEVACALENEQ